MTDRVTRPRLQKEDILDAAFHGWGRRLFTNCSLGIVADELGVTKPALYRHFRNKAELEEEVGRAFARRYRASVLESITGDPVDIHDLVRRFAAGAVAFFRRYPSHHAFLVSRVMRRSGELDREFDELWIEQERIVTRALKRIDPRYGAAAAMYLIDGLLFWISRSFRSSASVSKEGTVFPTPGVTESITDADIEDAVRTVLDGCDVPVLTAEERQIVERVAWIQSDELVESHKILTAIADVVLEIGYRDATMERIASHLGMTKSSLYFYFRNKDDMFGSMVRREQQHFVHLAKQRFAMLPTVSERLYAIFLLHASYELNHPAWSTVQTWLQTNRIRIALSDEDRKKAMELVRSLGESATNRTDATGLETVAFISVLAHHRLAAMTGHEKVSRETLVASLRTLYEYVTRGIAGAIPEEEQT